MIRHYTYAFCVPVHDFFLFFSHFRAEDIYVQIAVSFDICKYVCKEERVVGSAVGFMFCVSGVAVLAGRDGIWGL